MAKEIGLSKPEDLFSAVPDPIRLGDPRDGGKSLGLGKGKSELEVMGSLRGISRENTEFDAIFRGAGAYNHYIPSAVRSITAKDEFVTAYTPYQAELSQGILQSIFEFQSMICRLTDLDCASASVYDGAVAAAEALSMCRERTRTAALVSGTSNPRNVKVMRTYSNGAGAPIVILPTKDGRTDVAALEKTLADNAGTVASVYVETPNFYGAVEDIPAIEKAAHEAGAKLIIGANPIYLAVGKTPGEYGADVAVGEGQPLGMPLSFGGPYLGFMACRSALMRKLPGRIVGKTTDTEGRDAYVLTLQAREQHIRREKASSNICSNEALCALTAAVYMSAMGTDGMKKVATLCHSKAEYLKAKLDGIGFKTMFEGETFHEFVTTVPCDAGKLEKYLCKRGILPGLPIDIGGRTAMLWCATEMNGKEQIDALIGAISEFGGEA